MEGGGVRVRAEPSRRPRFAFPNQMSTIAADGRDLSGLTLDDILSSQKRTSSAAAHPPPPPPPPLRPLTPGRTLLDIIRDEDPKTNSFKGFGSRDKKAWRSFKDRLRLRRSGSGAAWTSSLHVPTSDILIPTSRSLVARRNSVRSLFTDSSSSPPPRRSLEMVMMTQPGEYDGDNDNSNTAASGGGGIARPQITRRSSSRFGANATFSDNDDHSDAGSDNSPSPRRRGGFHQAGPSLRPQISRRHSTRFATAMDDTVTDQTEPPPPQRDGSRRLSAVLAEERSLSAREAVAAQEAAEAAAVAASDDSEVPAAEGAAPAPAPVRMSLMDLLEETDRQMGFVGSRYVIGEEDDDDEYEEEEEVEEIAGGVGTAEQNCCVCMIRHKGAAFIPCGHTFCRLCSRELWVSRGNCPLCNGFILEILDIF